MRVPTKLIDARNIDQCLPEIVDENAQASMLGFDIETQDTGAHTGILEYRGQNKRMVFDTRRTIVTGFSTYAPGSPQSYYINLAHADIENRVPWPLARKILDARKEAPLVIHNRPFEHRMMKAALNYDIGEAICTMQLAVSCFGPDEYNRDEIGKLTSWPMINLIPQIVQQFRAYDRRKWEMTTQQAQLLGKVVAKESTAEWSYNGFNSSIAYGYGLKKLVRNFLKEEIGDFKELLKKYGATHMGELTGEQVADYGGDDSYFAIQLLQSLLARITPEALQAYMQTENPMTEVYGEISLDGCRINSKAVNERFDLETQAKKEALETLRVVCQAQPFPALPNAELLKREGWYEKGWQKHRKMVSTWSRPDKKPMNPMHYMPTRTILYDLFGLPLVLEKSKVESNGEARGKMLEKATGNAREALVALNKLAGVDQRIKLYLSPYKLLIDPVTQKMYPDVTSMLATRRMAGSNPNPMQLAKQGESTYVRGFFEPDNEDDV